MAQVCLWFVVLFFQVQEDLTKCVSMMSEVVQILQELATSALQQTVLLSGQYLEILSALL